MFRSLIGRRLLLSGLRQVVVLLVAVTIGGGAVLAQERMSANDVLRTRYELILELVRHTPTYSPPVASRAFGYVGVTAYEAVASGEAGLRSLAGQLNGLQPPPAREAGARYDEAVVLEAAGAEATRLYFSNTGPTGQRALAMMADEIGASVSAGVPGDVIARSVAHGQAIAGHVAAWAEGDGGAVVENMGFPMAYTLKEGPGFWVPTSLIRQQQTPLLPGWGSNRPLAMPSGATCGLPPPAAYSEDLDSPFMTQVRDVYEAGRTLTDEQRQIARFWSDDPMLSPTPPGHWIFIATALLDEESAPIDRRVDVLARLGIVLADAFIGCWHTKYEYDTIRPITAIRRLIDPKWEPLLITPPFPEYPSGHSTQSGAAAAVLEAAFGKDRPFTDGTHEDDGLPVRRFESFAAAAEEAGISRFYGGIHFRDAVVAGLEQGRCIGAYAVALKTRP